MKKNKEKQSNKKIIKNKNIDIIIGVIIVVLILLGIFVPMIKKSNNPNNNVIESPKNNGKNVENVSVDELNDINASLTKYVYELFNSKKISASSSTDGKLILSLNELEENYDYPYTAEYDAEKTSATITFDGADKILTVETSAKKANSNSGE